MLLSVLLLIVADDVREQADVTDPNVAAELKKKRTFRTFSYRGVELDKLLDLSNEEVRFVPSCCTLILICSVR